MVFLEKFNFKIFMFKIIHGILKLRIGGVIMNFGQIALNLAVMAVVFCLGYTISYILSKRYAEKKEKKDLTDKKQK